MGAQTGPTTGSRARGAQDMRMRDVGGLVQYARPRGGGGGGGLVQSGGRGGGGGWGKSLQVLE